MKTAEGPFWEDFFNLGQSKPYDELSVVDLSSQLQYRMHWELQPWDCE